MATRKTGIKSNGGHLLQSPSSMGGERKSMGCRHHHDHALGRALGEGKEEGNVAQIVPREPNVDLCQEREGQGEACERERQRVC